MKTLEKQLAETQALLDSIKLQIENKQKFPADGTICEVWDDNDDKGKTLYYSNGDGTFRICTNSHTDLKFDNFKPLEMGLTFSDEIINSKDITTEIDKQLALCWDSNEVTRKSIRVIDYKNKTTFNHDGKRDGIPWDNYKPCTTPISNLPKWARNMVNACED